MREQTLNFSKEGPRRTLIQLSAAGDAPIEVLAIGMTFATGSIEDWKQRLEAYGRVGDEEDSDR